MRTSRSSRRCALALEGYTCCTRCSFLSLTNEKHSRRGSIRLPGVHRFVTQLVRRRIVSQMRHTCSRLRLRYSEAVVAAGFVLLGVVRREIDGGDALMPQGVAPSITQFGSAVRRMCRSSPGEGDAYRRPLCDASLVGPAQPGERVAFGSRPPGCDAIIEAELRRTRRLPSSPYSPYVLLVVREVGQPPVRARMSTMVRKSERCSNK
jgi:hypothetical protein